VRRNVFVALAGFLADRAQIFMADRAVLFVVFEIVFDPLPLQM